ncbi:MAG: hypothetical protein J2P57_25680, partial [Acidimicrobiaceae bacterium]|nr:hypothetical protein [Acidimicrobiaceae bacterium]
DLNGEMVCWECDYPHSDSTWPRSPETVWAAVEGLDPDQIDPDQIDRITHLNAMRLFSYDPFSIMPREESTVGALRAKAAGHDVSLVARGTKEHRILTLGEFAQAARS